MEGVADPDQIGKRLDNTIDENEVSTPMAIEQSAKRTGDEAEEKNVSDTEAHPIKVKYSIGEIEEKGTKEVLTFEGEDVAKYEAEQSGGEKGLVAESSKTQRIEIEENGDKEAVTEQTAKEKSEAADDDRLDTSPPTPKRRKAEGRSVARTAAKKSKDPNQPPRNPERVELLKKMETLEDMKKLVAEHGRPTADYRVGDVIEVDDLMQTDYQYKLEAPIGKDFAEGFNPAFSPKEMLALGIFEGKIINDCIFEFPKEWYEEAIGKGTLSPEGPDDSKNYFKVKSRLSTKEWRKRGWLPKDDPRGWFQWYCRYHLGRRLEPDDTHQMSRWRQLRRHAGQIKKNCEPGDLTCRVKQRQTLLNWSHNCFM